MATSRLAWAQITYKKTAKKSPYIPVEVHILPSGECEAELHSQPQPIMIQHRSYNGKILTYVRTPTFKSDSAFCIGDEATILQKLRKIIFRFLGDSVKDVIIEYQKGATIGHATAAQEQSSTDHDGGSDQGHNSDSRCSQ